MAEKSSGEVFLLLKFDEPSDPPSNGHCATTWYRKEFPALKANTAVTKVSGSSIFFYLFLESKKT